MTGPYDPKHHYDRVTPAWQYLLGDALHYGVFDESSEPLSVATARLTALMAKEAHLDDVHDVLDVGCGTGAVTCQLAETYGIRAMGISTSAVGIEEARRRALTYAGRIEVRFEIADATDNGLPDESFDSLLVLESSHLMRQRDLLISECARVLRTGGRAALCDIVLLRELPFLEVRRMRERFELLRQVFGDAHMATVDQYIRWFEASGLRVASQENLTDRTRPTFDRWRANAAVYKKETSEILGHYGWRAFIEACDVLESFWDDEVLGYALIAATRS